MLTFFLTSSHLFFSDLRLLGYGRHMHRAEIHTFHLKTKVLCKNFPHSQMAAYPTTDKTAPLFLIGYRRGQNEFPSTLLTPLPHSPPYKKSHLPEVQKSSGIPRACTPSHRSGSGFPCSYNAPSPRRISSAVLYASSLLLPFCCFLIVSIPFSILQKQAVFILL